MLGDVLRLQACLARPAVRDPLPDCGQYAVPVEQVLIPGARNAAAAATSTGGVPGGASACGSCLEGATCIWPDACWVRTPLSHSPVRPEHVGKNLQPFGGQDPLQRRWLSLVARYVGHLVVRYVGQPKRVEAPASLVFGMSPPHPSLEKVTLYPQVFSSVSPYESRVFRFSNPCF